MKYIGITEIKLQEMTVIQKYFSYYSENNLQTYLYYKKYNF